MDSSFGVYGGHVPTHLPPYLLGSGNKKGSSIIGHNRHAPPTTASGSSEQVQYRSGGVRSEDVTLSRFEKLPLKGPPVKNLHDEPHTFSTSTPILPKSPERCQLNFSTVPSTRKSPMLVESLPTYDAGAPDCRYSSLHSMSLSEPDPLCSLSEEGTSNEDLEQYWITVFGYPSPAASFILSQFSQCGTILKYKVMSAGNWMHILYQSRLDAKKALGKNGKVFGQGIMVGVQRCMDKRVILNESESVLEHATETDKVSLIRRIRPLTAAYQAAASQNQVTSSTTNVPQKRNSLFSKAVDYIFGW